MISFQLSIENLSKSYGSREILSSISCCYDSGLIHGIIGANGSGKTTLFNCLSGNLSFQGIITYPEYLKMGYLPTELFMYPRITGIEFLHFCLTVKKIPIDTNKIQAFNQIFELPLNEYGETYSTGMLKKLYLLALILEKNDILILDEPFNGLDVNAVGYITELLLHLKNAGTLIFISSHIVDHLRSFCDTLTLIQNKEIQFVNQKDKFEQINARLKADTHKKIEIIAGIY